MKTSELTGAALDWAVAKCEDILHPWGYIRVQDGRVMWITPGNHEEADAWHQYSPSTDWAQGGPIIERERIATGFDGYDDIDLALPIWSACKYVDGVEGYGHTPLIAAMRCYVASKLGDDIDIPEELT
jgi:hypothetical protein